MANPRRVLPIQVTGRCQHPSVGRDPLFRVGTVPVPWHITCAIYPFGLLTQFYWHDHARQVLILALILLPLVGGSVWVHELAHVWAARCFAIGTRRVVFIPFAAVAELESMPRAASELWIALAGPAANFKSAGRTWNTTANKPATCTKANRPRNRTPLPRKGINPAVRRGFTAPVSWPPDFQGECGGLLQSSADGPEPNGRCAR